MCSSGNKWLPSLKPKDRLNPVKGAEEDTLKPMRAMKDKITPDIPEAPKPPPPPQATRAPDTTPLRRRNNAGSLASYSSTMLTGAGGVRGQMNLGSSTLLGS